MTYKVIYTNNNVERTLVQMSDDIYNDILATIKTSKDDNEVLVAVTDFLPTEMSIAFRDRFNLENED